MGYSSSYAQSLGDALGTAVETGSIEVPVLPEIANRVIVLSQDPESDAAQLAKIIQSDPTMGGHVIRIANSAAYTPNANMVSLQQAITRLGMTEIGNIAVAASMNSKMFNAPGYEKHIETIWTHSLASALWAKEVARAMRRNVEAAFLCGLLHSIGKPVILQTVADLQKKTPGELNDDDLEQLFSQYESAVCLNVAKEWELPTIVTEAIGHYQNFESIDIDPDLPATIFFSSQLATHMLAPETLVKDMLLDSPALEFVNLYPDDISKLLEKRDDIRSGMESLSP